MKIEIAFHVRKGHFNFFTFSRGLLDKAFSLINGTNNVSRILMDTIVQSTKQYGIKRMAGTAKVSVRHAHNIYHRKTKPTEKTITKLLRAGLGLDSVLD